MFDTDYLTRLERLSLAVKRGLAEPTAGHHAAARKGFGIEFEDYRTYSIGDDLRYVDWHLFARTESLFTKQYREEKQMHLTLLLDCSGSMNTGRQNKFEAARRLTGALGYIALANFDKLSLYPFTDAIDDHAHLSGKNMGPSLFRFLAAREAGGTSNLNRATAGLVRRTTGRGIALVVSDFLGVGRYDTAIRSLKAQRYQVHLIHLEDATDREPAFDGSVWLTDAETGATLAADLTPDRLHAYRQAYEAHAARLISWCRANEVGYTRVDSAEPFDTTILGLLKSGGLRV